MRSLRFKFAAGAGLLLVGILMFVVMYFPRQQRAQHLKAFESELSLLTETLALTVGMGLDDYDYSSMKLAFDFAKRDPNLEYIIVTDADRDVIGKYPEDATYDLSVLEQGLIEEETRVIHSSPIMIDEKIQGFVSVAKSLHEVNKATAASKRDTLWLGFLILSIGLVIVFVITSTVTRPLNDLSIAAKHISLGNYATRVEVRSRDETGVLAGYFNEMADAIQRGHDELEQRVRERTEALSETNAALKQNAEGLAQAKSALEEQTRELTVAVRSLRIARDAADASERLKSAILNNMSHEFRTPLTSILGFAETLEKEVADEHRGFMTLIVKNGRRLTETLNAVLDLASIESRTLAVGSQPIRVSDAVEAAIASLRPFAREKGVALRAELNCRMACAVADETALDQVLHQLIHNAIKFTEKGEVVVEVRREKREVVIDVKDTGIGIARTFMTRLFEPFAQESEGLNRAHEGSGLGLTLVSRLVQLMGGSVRAVSEKGSGTTFRVRLVRAEEDEERLDREAKRGRSAERAISERTDEKPVPKGYWPDVYRKTS
ncbi:MAG: HAMP domain-containing protein [Rhodothermales bacterium]|nr:HAMP domain-containing protein [Rhodothermales bacterium]